MIRIIITIQILLTIQCQYSIKNYPNPLTDPEACGIYGLTSSQVCDPEQLLNT